MGRITNLTVLGMLGLGIGSAKADKASLSYAPGSLRGRGTGGYKLKAPGIDSMTTKVIVDNARVYVSDIVDKVPATYSSDGDVATRLRTAVGEYVQRYGNFWQNIPDSRVMFTRLNETSEALETAILKLEPTATSFKTCFEAVVNFQQAYASAYEKLKTEQLNVAIKKLIKLPFAVLDQLKSSVDALGYELQDMIQSLASDVMAVPALYEEIVARLELRLRKIGVVVGEVLNFPIIKQVESIIDNSRLERLRDTLVNLSLSDLLHIEIAAELEIKIESELDNWRRSFLKDLKATNDAFLKDFAMGTYKGLDIIPDTPMQLNGGVSLQVLQEEVQNLNKIVDQLQAGYNAGRLELVDGEILAETVRASPVSYIPSVSSSSVRQVIDETLGDSYTEELKNQVINAQERIGTLTKMMKSRDGASINPRDILESPTATRLMDDAQKVLKVEII